MYGSECEHHLGGGGGGGGDGASNRFLGLGACGNAGDHGRWVTLARGSRSNHSPPEPRAARRESDYSRAQGESPVRAAAADDELCMRVYLPPTERRPRAIREERVGFATEWKSCEKGGRAEIRSAPAYFRSSGEFGTRFFAVYGAVGTLKFASESGYNGCAAYLILLA
jgi:hypothetical protein